MNTPKQSIFKYVTTDEVGNHFIYPDRFQELLKDEELINDDIKTLIQGHQFPDNLRPLIVLKKGQGSKFSVKSKYKTAPPKQDSTWYRHAVKEAIYKYRENNKDKINKSALDAYHKKMKDDEWRKTKNEKAKLYLREYRGKKSAELQEKKNKAKEEIKSKIEKGELPRDNKLLTPRGRPFGSSNTKKPKEQILEEFEKYKNKHYENLKKKFKVLHKDNEDFLKDYFKERLNIALKS